MFHSRLFIIKFIVALLVVTMSTKPEQVYSQGGIVVENAGVVVNFGQSITFNAKVTASNPIQQVSLLFREVNEEITRVESLDVAQDSSVSFTANMPAPAESIDDAPNASSPAYQLMVTLT